MSTSDGLDPRFIAELEALISKLASPMPRFSAKERELMQLLRIHRDDVLAQLRAVMALSVGMNSAGRRKLERIAVGIEEICRVD